MPANTVCAPGSVGSRASSRMEREGRKSVCGVQVGLDDVAFVVFHTPPFTEPRYITLALVGCGSSALTEPDTGLFCAVKPSVWPPVIGAAPWAIQLPAGRARCSNGLT